MHAEHSRMTDAQIEALARRRANARLGWLTHAFVFIGVNLFLVSIALAHGRAPRILGIGTLAWAFALGMHGIAVLGIGSALLDRLVARERTRLVAQRDPW